MVHFVGAGPGDPELLTVKGRRLIMEADVIIYAGSLVNPQLLTLAKEDAEIYDSKEMALPDIISVIHEKHQEGKDIVRLQTGDISLFSALHEQTEALRALRIPYDLCPGVGAFAAAAAALETEYTAPVLTQSVIITRAEGRTPVPDRESLKSFAAHGATMVLYLSAAFAVKVRDELMNGGMPGNTPAAVVYKASWPEQKVLQTTLFHLPDVMQQNGIRSTALIIIGEVLGEESSTREASRLYATDFTTAYRKGSDETGKTEEIGEAEDAKASRI